MFSSRSQSLSNKVNCHFCNSDSILLPKGQDPRTILPDTSSNLDLNLSSGSINDWICSQCDSRNLLDSNGKITSWNPEMNDESRNGKSRAVPLNLTHHQINRNGNGQGEGVFCKECLSNQRLALALLSSFHDSDQSPTSTSTSDSIQLFKTDIQKRYPQVCEKCLVKVEGIIEESNRNARSLMMGELMRRGLKRKQNGIGNGSLTNGIQVGDKEERGRGDGNKSRVKEMIWRIRGLAWILTHFLSLGTTLLGISSPQRLPCCPQASASITISSHRISNSNFNFQPRLFPTLLICFLSIFWTVWDPTWLRIIREAKKGVKLKVRGRDVWIRMQLQLYFLRFFLFSLVLSETLPELLTWSFNSILALMDWEVSETTLVRSFCLLGLLIQIILLFSSFQNLTTHRPKPPKLRSSASRLSPTISKNDSFDSHLMSQSRIDEGSRKQDGLWNLSLRDAIGTNPNVFDRNQPSSSFGVPSTFGQNPASTPGRFEDLFSRNSDSRRAEDEVDHQQEAFQQQEEMLSDDSEEDSTIPSSSLRWSTDPFGLRSRTTKSGKSKEKKRRRSDEMDWTPSNDINLNASTSTRNPNSQSSTFSTSRQSDFQFGPQRFFAPEKPTGLEDLFKESLGIDDNDGNRNSERKKNKGRRSFTRSILENDIFLTLLFALFAFFIFALFASGQFLKLFSIDYGGFQVQNGLVNGERSYQIGQNLASKVNEGFGFGFLKKEKEADEVERERDDVLRSNVDVGNEEMEIDVEEAAFYEMKKDVEEEFW